MAKSLNLKIKKAKLITQLNKALAERAKRFADNDKNEKQYEKAKAAYDALVLKLVKSGKCEIKDLSHNDHYWNKDLSKKEFSLTVKVPKGLLPEAPKQVDTYSEYTYQKEKTAIESLLRMLELADDEFVSASTLHSISEYL